MSRTTTTSKRRHFKSMLWGTVFILLSAMILPLTGYLYVEVVSAQSAGQDNPRANYWRAVREGNSGYTAASGPYTTNTLVANGGQNWRQVRNGPVASYGAGLLIFTLGVLAIFYLIRGSMKIEGGRSGRTVERWSAFERALHWYTAILFIVLAVTGLSMLFGRAVLIPVLGLSGFSAWATLSINLHNYLGPAFSIGVVVMILLWIKNNIWASYDFEWVKQAGGMFSKHKHPPAGKANAGEKIFVFWLGLVVCGLAVIITGFILDFPNYGQTRETMQLSQSVHAIASVVWIAFMLGHAYLGSIGIEGAFEGMTSGNVDANWARQHHSVWYEQVKHTESMDTSSAGSSQGLKQPS